MLCYKWLGPIQKKDVSAILELSAKQKAQNAQC